VTLPAIPLFRLLPSVNGPSGKSGSLLSKANLLAKAQSVGGGKVLELFSFLISQPFFVAILYFSLFAFASFAPIFTSHDKEKRENTEKVFFIKF
jgi:hypothetical protein